MVGDLAALLNTFAGVRVDDGGTVLGKKLAGERIEEHKGQGTSTKDEDGARGLDGSTSHFLARFELRPWFALSGDPIDERWRWIVGSSTNG